MALSERNRSALYLGLSTVVEEEAVQEMMSFFPARDVEEPVTKEFLRAEVSDLRAEMSDFRSELRAEMAELRAELASFEVRTEARFDQFEVRFGSEIRAEIRRALALNVGMLATFAAVIIAAVRF